MAEEISNEIQEAAAPEPTSYDRVPYASFPFAQTHPRRLSTIAWLFGMTPANVESCRVLELACAAGGNLIPMAEQLPGSHFVGIDASRVQIDVGQRVITELGLSNIELQQRDILEVGPELGKFDYIIAHGVYSWVPAHVQDKILEICKQNLNPQGIAYISYNTNPGWRLRGTIRDVMRYRAKQFQSPRDQVRQSMALVNFLAQSAPKNTPYGHMLNVELKGIQKSQGYYLLHEYLEDVNEALYFHEFIDRVAPKGLQYLGEAEYWSMSVNNFGPEIARALHQLSSDLIQMEQYMDFVRNRTFRQTLICHSDVELKRRTPASLVEEMYVSSEATPAAPIENLLSREPVRFTRPSSTVTTDDPLLKAVMLHLLDSRPVWTSFRDLVNAGKTRVTLEAASQGKGEQQFIEDQRVAEMLLSAYATNVVDLSLTPYKVVQEIADLPVASPFARLQARTSLAVTNRQHGLVGLNGFQQFVIQKLDGKHKRDEIIDELYKESRDALVLTNSSGGKVTEESEVKEILAKLLEETLRFFVRQSLLSLV